MNNLYVFAVCAAAWICVASAEVVKFDPCNLSAEGDYPNYSNYPNVVHNNQFSRENFHS